ncbi:macrophage mannose receptor 1-like [Diadema antillarum]|uniref:macrophage mannose receptor 1-like n=1 Tax=Diadema antillarum TaxID=105358 RepID=UPI003A844A1B
MILRLFLLFSLAGLVLSQSCGTGWLQYQDTCFLLVSMKRPYQLARDYCQNNQAELAVLTSRDMNTWLAQQTSIYPEVFWIGLHDIQSDGSFTWVDGTPLDPGMANWAPTEPNNIDGIGEDCVEMYASGKWNDEQCLAINWFICSRSLNVVPKCDSANGWESFNGKCYLWISDTKSIGEAKTYCNLLDGYVISINDAAEQSFANSIQASKANIPYWTGLSDQGQSQGVYMWQDGTDTSSYSNWDVSLGEPSNIYYPNDCVQISSYETGFWTVNDCSVKNRFICERPEGTCAPGWILHGGQCYQYNSMLRTWFDAKYYCEAQGGYLGSILDDTENSFIAGNLGTINAENVDSMWFGYSDVVADGTWTWSHETDSTYTNWAPGLPTNTYAQTDCAYMATSDTTGKWYQKNCQLLSGFMCKIRAGSVVTPVQPEEQVGSCNVGWSLYGDHCYYFPTEVVTHSEALTMCQSYYSDSSLVSIHSNGEQSFLTERVAYIGESMWIGLHDKFGEFNWEWEDGTPYDYFNWAPGEPNNAGGEDCVHIESYFYKVGTWNDHKCDRLFRFICKMPKSPGSAYSTPVPTTFPPSDRCGSGWIYDASSGSCYKYDREYRSWQEADLQCRSEGGRLTSLSNYLENEFVQRYAYYFFDKGVNSFWVGLHASNLEYGFQWSDGAPLAYLNWQDGEPNNAGGEDCVEMYADSGRWNDLACSNARNSICKRNVYASKNFVAYPNARLDTTVDAPLTNVWPEECAFFCMMSVVTCRSFNYYRSGRQCVILTTDKDSGSTGLVPEFEDPWDYYQRDFNAPTNAPPTPLDPSYGCSSTEYAYRGYCYSLVTDMYSFTDMQNVCQLRTSQLASVADVSENNFILSLTQMGNEPDKEITGVWLGLTDKDREATFAWTDGSPVTYTVWALGEPNNNLYDDDCVYFDVQFNGWRVVPCTGMPMYGVCKKPQSDLNVVVPSNDGCPTGWMKYMSTCYQMFGDKLSWADARDSCIVKGGKLATMNNKFDQAFIAAQLGATSSDYTGDDDYWIGLSDTDIPGTYKWVDGSYPTISAWGPGQPDDSLGKCVAMIGGYVPFLAGLWVDEPCTNTMNYICEQPAAGTTDTPYTQGPVTSPSDDGCDDPGAIGYGYNCFIVYEKPQEEQLSFSDARAQCQSIGGDLASFHSIAEEQYVVGRYSPASEDNFYGFWLGLNDINQEGAWQWSDNTAVIYVNWEAGEPNDHSDTEECTEMFLNPGRGWNDIACYAVRSWVCKKPKSKEPTRPTPLPNIGVCPSDSNWKYVAPYCYYLSDIAGEGDRKSWSEAQAYCQTQGGHLVSITSGTENQLLMAMAPTVALQYWIGLRQEIVDGPYAWSDGSPYTYANWNPGEPNNKHGEESCAEISKYSGSDGTVGEWNDQNCGVPTPFICKRLQDSITPITNAPTPEPTGGCDNGYFKYYNRCYRMGGYDTNDRYKWKAARDVCIAEGGNLVGIHDKRVQSLLTSMLLDMPTDVWIGFSDLGSPGQYHWTDGKAAVYTNWLPGEPSGRVTFPGEESRNCVEMMNDPSYAGKWNDVQCDEVIAYMCEKDLVPGASEDPPSSSYCNDRSYFAYDGDCYKVDTTQRTYAQALDFCRYEGGNLASITDSFHDAYLEYLLYSSGVPDAWIGMTRNEDGEYAWSDGWPVYYSQWGDSEPSQRPGEGCVVLNDDPAWDDVSCSGLHATICRQTSKVPPTPVPTLPGDCPAGQSEFGGHCYYVPNEAVFAEWFTARYICQSQYGGELVSIHSQEENEFVRNLAFGTQGVRSVWLGLTRSETGGFKYTDGTPVDYVHWANGEPTEDWAGSTEDCVEIYTNEYGKWNDEDCYASASYVCKMDKRNNDTQAEPVISDNGSLSSGAIAGIVIAMLVIVAAVVLVVGYFVGVRGKSKPAMPSTSSSFPTPAPPAGFDNALYVSGSSETKVQVEEKSKEPGSAEA